MPSPTAAMTGMSGMSGMAGAAAVPKSLQDTMVDSSGVAIQSHTPTPSGGFTWTVFGGTGAIQSNALQSATSGTAMVVGAATTFADGALGFDATVPASGKFCFGAAVRIVSATSYIALMLTNDGGTSYVTIMSVGGG